MIDFLHPIFVALEFRHHEKADRSISDRIQDRGARRAIFLTHFEEAEAKCSPMLLSGQRHGVLCSFLGFKISYAVEVGCSTRLFKPDYLINGRIPDAVINAIYDLFCCGFHGGLLYYLEKPGIRESAGGHFGFRFIDELGESFPNDVGCLFHRAISPD